MKIREIDPKAAIRLYNEGLSWAEIGRILALRRKRRSPFQAVSVKRAVKAFDRRQPRTLHRQSASHLR